MAYLPLSAFRRHTSYVELERTCQLEASAPRIKSVAKWTLFNALVKAKEAFNLSERDLGVLQGLLTFHPQETLEYGSNLIIFPSNRKICERLHGMADSTMRRHLRNLLASGLLLRRDSANGKRFALHQNVEIVAFGFDLSPLLHKASEIFNAAEHQKQIEGEIKKLKLEISLMRRDLFALFAVLEPLKAQAAEEYWKTVSKILRRKLSLENLQALKAEHTALLNELKSTVINSSDNQNEQHIHNSNIKYYESEEKSEADQTSIKTTELPLEVVRKACPTLEQYSNGVISHWSHLHDAAYRFHSALGITKQCYLEAVRLLGLNQTSIVIAAILERFDKIRSPGAYLRSLTKKAAAGKFSVHPMVMALISTNRRS